MSCVCWVARFLLHRSYVVTFASQQTQNICIKFIQFWSNIEDVGQKCFNVKINNIQYQILAMHAAQFIIFIVWRSLDLEGALVQWLKLPAWKIWDSGFEPHSGL